MNREQVQNVIDKVGPIHHALAGMLSNMNLALEILDTLTLTEQAELNQYWQQKHREAIQHLQESLTALPQASREAQSTVATAPGKDGPVT